jgi:hypothetical protein
MQTWMLVHRLKLKKPMRHTALMAVAAEMHRPVMVAISSSNT